MHEIIEPSGAPKGSIYFHSPQGMEQRVREALAVYFDLVVRRGQRRGLLNHLRVEKTTLKPGPRREAMEREFLRYLEAVRDPELRRKLTPAYHLGCTRIPKSDNYCEAVQRPNVHIETQRIERIVPRGVQLAGGSVCELDALV